MKPLNQELRSAAITHGWNYIGGVADIFRPHDYCSTSSWITSLSDAVANGTGPGGTMHPNGQGNAQLARMIADAIKNDVLAGSSSWPVDDQANAPATLLADAAQAGDNELVVDDAAGFQVGDTLGIDPGTGRFESGTVVGFGSLVLEKPLLFDHLAGSLVVTMSPTTSSTSTTTTFPPATCGHPISSGLPLRGTGSG